MFWILVVIVGIALLLSAFVSGTETAFLAVNKYRLRSLMRGGDKRAERLAGLVRKPEDMFSALLLLNNLLNILIAVLIGALVSSLVTGNQALSSLLAVAITTVLVVFISELTPKSIAATMSERWALNVAGLFNLLIIVLRPIIAVMAFVPGALLRLLRTEGSETLSPRITPNELRQLVDIGEEEGTVENSQGELLENVFRFGEKTVADIMVPRPKIVWLNHKDGLAEFLERYKRHGYTIFPVRGGKEDDVAGFIHSKDVLRMIAKRGYSADRSITPLIQEPLFIPESSQLDELFALISKSGAKLTLAVDEFGTISGLVSITQLLEQILGPSGSGHQELIRLPNGTYLVDGSMSVEELKDETGLDLTAGDYETMAGWFLSLSGQIPTESDVQESDAVLATIRKMDGERIVQILLAPKKRDGESAASG